MPPRAADSLASRVQAALQGAPPRAAGSSAGASLTMGSADRQPLCVLLLWVSWGGTRCHLPIPPLHAGRVTRGTSALALRPHRVTDSGCWIPLNHKKLFPGHGNKRPQLPLKAPPTERALGSLSVLLVPRRETHVSPGEDASREKC